MAKTLTEMTADIVKAQAGVTRMSAEELSEALAKTYDSLKRVKNLEEGNIYDGIILAVKHEIFRERGDIKLERMAAVMNGPPVLIDVCRYMEGDKAREKGFYYRTL